MNTIGYKVTFNSSILEIGKEVLMEQLLGAFAMFGIFILIIVLGIYIAISIFLNKFNKLVYGKGTAMAWIPVFNVYLLGKLTINKIVGWSLVICIFLTGTYTITFNGVEKVYTILPGSIKSIVSTLYNLAVLGLLIYAIVKYNRLKKNGVHNNLQQPQQYQQIVSQPQQPVANQMQGTFTQNTNYSNGQDQVNSQNNQDI